MSVALEHSLFVCPVPGACSAAGLHEYGEYGYRHLPTSTINIDCAPVLVWWPLEPFPVQEIGKARCNHHLLLGCTPKHASCFIPVPVRREYGWKPSVDATRTQRSALAQAQRETKTAVCFHVSPEACTEHYLFI